MPIKTQTSVRAMLLAALIVLMTIISAAPAYASGIDEEEAKALAVAMTEEYIYATRKNRPHDFSQFTSIDYLVEYVDSIVAEIQESGGLPSVNDDTFKVTVSVAEYKNQEYHDYGDYVRIMVHSYEEENGGTSSFGDYYYVIVAEKEGGGLEIRDWSLDNNGYEYRFRGKDYVCFDPDYWLDEDNAKEVLARARKEREIGLKTIWEQAQNNLMTQYSRENTEQPSIMEESSSITLNKDLIAWWATQNCTKNPPTSAIPGVDYCDFSQWNDYDDPTAPKNWDCTNFASHALIYGGAIMNSDSWYYYGASSSQRSTSWSDVDKFYNFLVNNKSTGPYGKALAYSDSLDNSLLFDEGDIIQFDIDYDDSDWTHTTILTGFSMTGTNTNEATVSGRSSTRSEDQQDDSRVSVVKQKRGYTRVRAIKILGCRK